MYNGRDTPIQSIKVRQAIMHGMNYKKMLKVVLRGEGRKIHQWAFPENMGFNPDIVNFVYDPEKAKALLAEAGYSGGFKMHLVVEDTAKYIVRAIKADLKKIGIEVTYQIVDEQTIIQIGLEKDNDKSELRSIFNKMDIMVGDCHEYNFFHNLATQIWTFHSSSVLNFADKPDDIGDAVWTGAMETFGDESAKHMWQKVVKYEFDRLGTATAVEKYKFFASRKDLIWKVHSLWDLRNAYYK